jgi:hypothetical protein
MRKLALTITATTAILVNGALAWQAQAQTSRAAAVLAPRSPELHTCRESTARRLPRVGASLSAGPRLGVRSARLLVPMVLIVA